MNPDYERIRRVILRPYRPGEGPVFTLEVYDTHQLSGHKSRLAYRLKASDQAEALFEGDDFCCSPLHPIDSDSCIAGLLSFLTLRPGDTDREYFEHYTEAQLDFCALHAEHLAMEVESRFGETA